MRVLLASIFLLVTVLCYASPERITELQEEAQKLLMQKQKLIKLHNEQIVPIDIRLIEIQGIIREFSRPVELPKPK